MTTFSYSSAPWGKIDIIPATSGGSRGVIVWVHGGAWISGSRDFSEIPFYVTAMLAQGWSIASVEYPSALSATPVQMVQSVEQAVTYVRENSALFGVDTRTVVLGGHSAGGWLAAAAAYNGALKRDVDGVIAFAAPLDLVALAGNSKPLYGFTLASLTNVLLDCAELDPAATDACGRELLSAWSVHNLVRKGDPSVYLGYGDLDAVVPAQGSASVVRKFEAALGTNRVWVDVAEGSGHAVEGVNVRYLAAFLALVAQDRL
jgi:acetyl esterase/lipase